MEIWNKAILIIFKEKEDSNHSASSDTISSKRRIDIYFTPINMKRQCRVLSDTCKEEILKSGGILQPKFEISTMGAESPWSVPSLLRRLRRSGYYSSIRWSYTCRGLCWRNTYTLLTGNTLTAGRQSRRLNASEHSIEEISSRKLCSVSWEKECLPILRIVLIYSVF